MNHWDWSILKNSVLWLAFAIIFSAVITVVSFQYYQTIQSDYSLKKKSLLIAQQRSVKALDDSNVLTKLLPRFTALQEAGVIGDEQRLNWVDTIQNLGERLKIGRLDYEINERLPYENEGAVDNLSHLQVYGSRMNVNMQFLHEGDFLTFLQALRHRASGLFHIEACGISRLQAKVSTDGQAPNVAVECDLLWLTVQYDKGLSNE